MRLSELPVRLVRPLDSHRLPGHNPQELLHAAQETAHILKTVYRPKLKSDAMVAADSRRARIVAYINDHWPKRLSAPMLQEALGVSKGIMQADMKILRESKQIGFSFRGKTYGYFAR